MSQVTDALLRQLLERESGLRELRDAIAELTATLLPILDRMESDSGVAGAVGDAVRAAVQPLQDAVGRFKIPAAEVQVQQQDLAPLVAAIRAQPAPQVVVNLDAQALAAAIVETMNRQQGQRTAEIIKTTNGRGETVYQVTSR